MKEKIGIAALVVLALSLMLVPLGVTAQETDYPATVDPYEEIDVGLDFSGSGTTVDVYINDTNGTVVESSTVTDDGTSTVNETFDVHPGDYSVTVTASDSSNVSSSISVVENNLIEERSILVDDLANQTITADATVSGSSNVSIQTVIEYNGEILHSETNSYDGTGNTEILSSQYNPPENGTYVVRQEVVSGDASIVDSVYFDTIDPDSAVVGTGDSFLDSMSTVELVGVFALAGGLMFVLAGGRDP
jgi:preprotein translocase subunit SecD